MDIEYRKVVLPLLVVLVLWPVHARGRNRLFHLVGIGIKTDTEDIDLQQAFVQVRTIDQAVAVDIRQAEIEVARSSVAQQY